MPKNEKESLFRGLTRLFRSGPIVKRKVKLATDRKGYQSSALDLFKRSQSHVYSNAINAYGQYDRMCLELHTKIPVPGPERFKTLKQLIDEYPNGEQFIVYAYDHEKEQIVPAWAHHPRVTDERETVKITFDDGSELICTPDHPCMVRDGSFRDAGELESGDSMMPFYRKSFGGKSKKDEKSFEGYANVYTMAPDGWNGWVAEHKLIAEWSQERRVKKHEEHVHHKDYNPQNNSPDNLVIMDAKEHLVMHGKKAKEQWRDPATRAKMLAGIQRAWDEDDGSRRESVANVNKRADVREMRRQHWIKNNVAKDPAVAAKISELAKLRYQDLDARAKLSASIKRAHAEGRLTTSSKFSNYWKGKKRSKQWRESRCKEGAANYVTGLTIERFIDAYDACGADRKAVLEFLSISPSTLQRRLKEMDFKGWSGFCKSRDKNHTVVSVESNGISVVGDLTVDGYENFATNSIVCHNSRYADFSEMEYTPEIASALDIYADEAVAQDDKGQSLHIFSNNPQVRKILGELFYDTLNIDFNLRPWVRNLTKYGDFFLFNDVSPEHGIINVFPVPVNEIEREEGFDPEDPLAVRYRWVTQGNQVLENWQVTHLRLLGNDAFLPYGSSILEPARRIWRQLVLIEDAMLVYRVVRSPERRIFYIDVGNVTPEDVPAYMEKAKAVLRSNQVVDKATGRVDLRYNPLPISVDSLIPLLDGRTLTMGELAAEYDEGKENWVYSVQDGTHRIVPGKVIWCGKNYTADELVRVWFTEDRYVDAAPEHPFLLRDGHSKRADELEVGDRLMPLYRDVNNKGYERCYNPETQSYETTHKLVATSAYLGKWEAENRPVVHHKEPWKGDANKRNNTPGNLEVMDFWEHRKWHQDQIQHTLLRPEVLAANGRRIAARNKTKQHSIEVSECNQRRNSVAVMSWYNGSDLHRKHNENRRQGQLKSWRENENERKKAMRWIITDEMFERICDIVRGNPRWGREKVHKALIADEVMMERFFSVQLLKRDPKKFSVVAWQGDLKRRGYERGLPSLRESIVGYKNHRITRIENIDGPIDVYCMTIVGPNGENDRHNFATVGDRSCSTTPSIDGIYVLNSVDEDYFIPVRGSETGTRIDTLPGGTHISAIEDVEYIQKKLFAALKVPRAYLGYDEVLSSKATLAQEDIRFSRTINIVQRIVIAELNKIAAIHLYAHGFEGEDLLDFQLHLSNPSTIAQQQKLELYRSRLEIAGTAPEGLVDFYYLRKNVMGMTDDEIKKVKEGLEQDRKFMAYLESMAEAPEGGLGGGGGGEAGGGDLFAAHDKSLNEEDDEDDLLIGDREDDEELLTGMGSDLEGSGEEEEPVRGTGTDTGSAPVRPNRNATITRNMFNRRRRRTHGASKTHMPDFGGMVDITSPTATDVFDRRALGIDSNPLKGSLYGEGDEPEPSLDDVLDHTVTEFARMTRSMRSMLKSAPKGKPNDSDTYGGGRLLSEVYEEEEDFELDIEIDVATEEDDA